MCILLSFIHNVYPTVLQEQRLWVMEEGAITLNDIWWYSWHNWVGFLCLISTIFTYKISQLPCWHCSITQVALFLPQNSKPGSQEESQGFESWRALLGGLRSELSWSLGLCWLSSNCDVEILLGFLCCWLFFLPYTVSLPTPKKHSRVAGCSVMACFPAELSSTAATCWKPLLVVEDVCLRQQQSHFLADMCS